MRPTALALLAALAAVSVGTTDARPIKNRFGFQNMAGTYVGGYAIKSEIDPSNLAGPARLRIATSPNGRSARVTWTNTFYNGAGSYRISLQWIFSNGSLVASGIDPQVRSSPARGTVTLSGARPVRFAAAGTTSGLTADGEMKLLGGGAISIKVTLNGLPAGALEYSFSGARLPGRR